MSVKDINYNFQKKILENIIRNELNTNYFRRDSHNEEYFLKKNKILIDESFILKLIKKNKLIPFISENLFIKRNLQNLYIQVKNKAKIEFLKSIRLSLLLSDIVNRSFKYIVLGLNISWFSVNNCNFRINFIKIFHLWMI